MITARLRAADHQAFDRWAGTSSPLADAVLPRLTRAADRSKLWFATGAALAAVGGDHGRRAAVRGVASVAVTSGLVNGPAKWAFRRQRPSLELVPLARRLRRQPVSGSFPSGHSASAAAFATAVGMEWPALAMPVGAAAVGVAWSRVHAGVHYPSDCAVGMLLGATAAVVVRAWWPAAPVAPAAVFTPAPVPASADGAEVAVVVNTASGSSTDAAEELRSRLPAARIVELHEGDDAEEALRSAAESARVLAVAGGDGTVSVAARVAADTDRPLLVLPCGTLNHFARQLGIETTEDALDALAAGTGAMVDLGDANGLPFVNTSSLGGYSRLVPRRERLEPRIGKWPAMVVALVTTLPTDQPLELTVDGQRRRVWLLFCGNGCYMPPGLAPTWRPRLDEGLADVRIVSADRPWSRTRVVIAALLRRLPACPAYEVWSTRQLDIGVIGEPTPLARDGEVGDPVDRVSLRILPHALRVYRATGTATG
ncbi:MAG: bifunctional phosphatase PAP2/diacylglycerol kinase family protein [Frankiaceae bacterium]